MPASKATATPRIALCRECDWLVDLPARRPGQRAVCPRCHHHLTGAARPDTQPLLAWSLATLIVLGLVFAFPFLGFSTHGVGHVMRFIDTAHALAADQYAALAAVLLLTTVGLPGVYLAALAYVLAGLRLGRGRPPGALVLARGLRALLPWMMSDVFIVGVLVSLVKIVSLANIHVYASFVAFCGYSLMLLKTLTLLDWHSFWDAIAAPVAAPDAAKTGASGRSQSLRACRGCDTPFNAATRRRCPRCGKRHHRAPVDRRQLTGALLVTSVIAYIPANIYPVLFTEQLGQVQPQTIAAGVMHLAEAGDWPIAAIIFVASILVPISKIVALGWLCIAAGRGPGGALAHTRAYRITEKIGRWSMIDVFVVAVLATLVQSGSVISIEPGPGIIAFAAVVILTMIAAQTFDTRLLWPDESPDEAP